MRRATGTKVGRPRKCGNIPLTAYQGILENPPPDKPLFYTCSRPIVFGDWIHILGSRGIKFPEIQIIATPTSFHIVAENGPKYAIIDVSVENSYQYACDKIYKIVVNLPAFVKVLKRIICNSTSEVQIYTMKDMTEGLFLKSKDIGAGPYHTDQIYVNSFEVLKEAPAIIYEAASNPDGATFRNFSPDTFKKQFKSKSYSDGSPFCELTITGTEVTIHKPTPIGDSPKTMWESREDIEIPADCIIKSMSMPYRDVGEFCSKDAKNPVTIMVSDECCRMVRRIYAGEHVELLFYYCVSQQNVV